jgi:type IV secretory pathway TraG/TraD family ATPase VirD4
MVLVVLLVETAAGAWLSAWRRRVRSHRIAKRSGLAQPDALDDRLGRKAVAKTAVRLRPTLAQRRELDADEAGALVARQRDTGTPLYVTHEDSKLVVAPVRMGKTGRQAVADVLRAPGAVLATSTRFDLLELTIMERKRTGTVMVFDPEGRTPWPTTMRWSPIAGCENYDTALRRAVAICSARPLTDTKSGGYFGGQAEGVMAALLHAAALVGVGVDELRGWSTSLSRRPVHILDTDSDTALGAANELRTIIDSAESSHDSTGGRAIYGTLALLLRSLASPATRAACSPGKNGHLDIDAFIRDGRDTLYLVSRGRKNSAAPIVNALAKEILHRADVLSQLATAEQLAMPAYGDLRLDPPLRAVLDEAANVTPLDDLPERMADSGGRGIETYVYVQSLSQLRQRWGPEQAIEIWDNSSVKLVLGGLSAPRDLEEISRLLPERAIDQASISSGPDRSHVTVSQRMQRALTPDEIRELPDGQALMFYRNLRGAVVDLPGWWETELAERVQRSRVETRRLVAGSGRTMPTEPDDRDESP